MKDYLLKSICFCLLGLLLAACQPAVQYAKVKPVTLSRGLAQTVDVHAAGDWRDTGVRIKPGESYEITAKGIWSMGGICGNADADGTGTSGLCTIISDPWGISARVSSLVGRIGSSGRPFGVGRFKTLKGNQEGILYLRAYDDLIGDNSGSMTVTIKRQGAPVQQAAAPPPPPAPVAAPAYKPVTVPKSGSLPPLQPAVQGGKRVALVIGNSRYRMAPLANPANDARLIAATLRSVGFDVLEHLDADQKQMKRAVNAFGDKLEAAGRDAVGLFYYAGHGVQVGGRNYLLPLGSDIQREKDVDVEGVAADSVLGAMAFAGNRLNFMVLDACRNNPFKRSFRSAVRGLARMDAPRGTLIAYATGPGDVAADGSGDNSPYSESLARALVEKGVSVERMFRQVRNAVMQNTNNKQVPWEASSLTGGDFFFNPQ